MHSETLFAIEKHCSQFFDGHESSAWTWTLGPIGELAPWFQVLRYAPGPKTGLWTYVSVGASLLSGPDKRRLEFLLLTATETPRAVDLLAMVALYHL
ncbi:MAG: suppressor of fused domain protein, partial [Lentisphaeria bacterium]|nr:suppressor of fused domain protein [Lentisphaeria bacterium]